MSWVWCEMSTIDALTLMPGIVARTRLIRRHHRQLMDARRSTLETPGDLALLLVQTDHSLPVGGGRDATCQLIGGSSSCVALVRCALICLVHRMRFLVIGSRTKRY